MLLTTDRNTPITLCFWHTEEQKNDLKLLEIGPDQAGGPAGKPKVLVPKALDADDEDDDAGESDDDSDDDEVAPSYWVLLPCHIIGPYPFFCCIPLPVPSPPIGEIRCHGKLTYCLLTAVDL